MKIAFDDKSFVECLKTEGNNIRITISAKDGNNALKKITNSVEITMEQFKQLISEVM
jgi:hypothetical protein